MKKRLPLSQQLWWMLGVYLTSVTAMVVFSYVARWLMHHLI